MYTFRWPRYILHTAKHIHLRAIIDPGGYWGAAHWPRTLVAKARGSLREGIRHCGDDGNRRREAALFSMRHNRGATPCRWRGVLQSRCRLLLRQELQEHSLEETRWGQRPGMVPRAQQWVRGRCLLNRVSAVGLLSFAASSSGVEEAWDVIGSGSDDVVVVAVSVSGGPDADEPLAPPLNPDCGAPAATN
jgi:hypothetical protein